MLLENKINSNFTNIEVLNFGVSSSTISDHYNQLKKDVVKYNPDLVIYYEDLMIHSAIYQTTIRLEQIISIFKKVLYFSIFKSSIFAKKKF